MKLNRGIFLILLGASLFGFTPVFAKFGFNYGYSLDQIIISQMVISFTLLWLLTLSRGSGFSGINIKSMFQLMMTGSFVGLTSVFYYGALQYLPASLAIILMFQFVWIGIVLEWIFNNIKPAPVTILSIILILIGVIFASDIVNGNIQGLPLKGFLFGILSAFTYAGFIFFSGKVAVDVNPWTRTSFMVTGSMILILIIFMRDIPAILPLEKNLMITATGVSLFGSVLPPLLLAAGIPLVTGGIANILTSIELPVAILSASIILSETITPLQWIGTAIILIAIALNELGTILLHMRRHY